MYSLDTMRLPLLVCLSALLPCLAIAQNDTPEFHHHNISFGAGPAIPVGNSTNYLSTAPFIRLSYGYRFNQLFQADAAFQMAFGAAHNPNPEFTGYGQVMGGDHEFMFPMLGGRVYIPQHLSKRTEVSAGVGAVHLHYSETAPSNSNGYGYSTGCLSCTTRGGWGAYGLINVSYFLDSNHIFRLGTTLQYVAGTTSGQAVATFPAARTTDHWVNLAFEFGLSL